MLSEVSQVQKDKAHMFFLMGYVCVCMCVCVCDRHNTNISNIMKNWLSKGKVTNGKGMVKEGS
jgi:hypothetical protein